VLLVTHQKLYGFQSCSDSFDLTDDKIDIFCFPKVTLFVTANYTATVSAISVCLRLTQDRVVNCSCKAKTAVMVGPIIS